jgi:hypothetical protein
VSILRRSGPRFLVEIAAVLAVPAVTAAAGGTWQLIVPFTAATWVAIAVMERSLSRPRVAEAGAVAEPPAVEEPPRVRIVGRAETPVEVAGEVEPVVEPVAPPLPAPEPEPVAEPEPVPVPVAAREAEPVRVAEPEPEPEPDTEPEPVAAGPHRWNLWNLERVAREHAGDNEELSYLLMYLREFASADGLLPADFDVLVRESFGDLLAAGVR